MKRHQANSAQLSLFEPNEEPAPLPQKKPSIVDFARARFEQEDKPMTQEEYKKWIRFLVNNCFKSMP